MRARLAAYALAWVVAGASLSAWAVEYPVLSANVQPAQATIGEPITLSLQIVAPDLRGLSIKEPFKDDKSATWSLLTKRPSMDEKVNATEWRRRIDYTLATFATGQIPTPSIEVTYTPVNGGAARTKLSPSSTVNIKSLLPNTTEKLEPKAPKPPVAVPFPRWIYLLGITGLLLVSAWLGYFVWKRMRRRISAIVHRPKPLDEWALEELLILERSKLIEQKKAKEFYTRLSDTVRVYLGRLLDFDALDMTSYELVQQLKDSPLNAHSLELVEGLLEEADLVKFAKFVPETGISYRALERSREIVRETKGHLAPPETEQPAGAAGQGTPPAAPGALLALPLLQTSSGDFRFASPLFLLLLLVVPALLYWFLYRERNKTSTLRFSNLKLIKAAARKQSHVWRTLLLLLRCAAVALLVIAMARPQFGRVERQTYSEGIDIMLVLDVSLSMGTKDFYPNRLEAAKEVMKEFVDHRMGDRIGLVIFGSQSANLVPLTLDYSVVKSFIERVRFGIVDGNSTAIGMGLSSALKKLKDSSAKSKTIILLTDGENNAGKIDPQTAAEAARASKVRVYTIGVGSDSVQGGFMGMAPESGLNEESLTKIADLTGGMYFRATDNEKLSNIYAQIDKLEKSRVKSTQFDNFNDLVHYLAAPALLLLALEILLRSTRFIKIP